MNSMDFETRLTPPGWNRDWLHPVGWLLLATCISGALLAARVCLTGHWRQFYLVWNLFLAWLPLVFALAATGLQQRVGPRRWSFRAAATAWLLFFPNAPYILTDLVHLGPRSHGVFWADLVLILLFALIGVVLGFLSLHLMQQIVAQRFGWLAGWLFVVAVTALSGFGIYLGRFHRWNSWDIVVNPFALLSDLARWFLNMPTHPKTAIIPILFTLLVLLTYVTLHALTHLPAASFHARLQPRPTQ
jgi:uncharacterized membrane protein